jgi:hypothetical protein
MHSNVDQLVALDGPFHDYWRHRLAAKLGFGPLAIPPKPK